MSPAPAQTPLVHLTMPTHPSIRIELAITPQFGTFGPLRAELLFFSANEPIPSKVEFGPLAKVAASISRRWDKATLKHSLEWAGIDPATTRQILSEVYPSPTLANAVVSLFSYRATPTQTPLGI